ncbi:hypothetical protein [Noviherbaspirillum massiliense]|uniref:hypothetical protein n=1 Tax=Noviherbaspirillum massiliense TaxID=1465823 RepID=UPI0002D9D2ED|nr:hypothetical protein [Noviherbaspirillum massiliense]
MTRPQIPEDIIRFILLSIPSVPHLEAMLLLRREHSVQWDSKRVAQRLYMSEKAAHGLLTDLHAAGFLAQEDGEPPLYRYHPGTEGIREMIDRLADVYAKNLIDVSNLIHSKNSKKAQQFADAFIWRKDS